MAKKKQKQKGSKMEVTLLKEAKMEEEMAVEEVLEDELV